MTAAAKVSVIIPTFNHGKFIEACLQRLFSQHLEIICVDALSKDDTLDILEKYAEKGKIKLVYAKKRSYGYQMNLGLQEAKCKYVAFLSPMQMAEKTAFAKMTTMAEKGKLDILQNGCALFRREFLLEQKLLLPELPGTKDPLPEFLEDVLERPLRTARMKEAFFRLQEIENKNVEPEKETTETSTACAEVRNYIFPFHLFPRGARVVIYGREEIAFDFFSQCEKSGWVKPVAIIDSAEILQGNQDKRLVVQDHLLSLNFDYVLLSNLDKATAQRQKAFLLGMGLKGSCIKWQGEAYRFEDWQKNFYLPLLGRLQNFNKPHGEKEVVAPVASRTVLSREKGKKYIFVDLSFISKTDLHTGIQRVVNNTYWQMKKLSRDIEIVPTQYGDGGLLTCYAYEARFGGENKEELIVELTTGDTLFFLDSVWDFWRDMVKLMKLAKSAGAKCAALFHDLISIKHPEFTISQEANNNFEAWLALSASYMDFCLCDSKCTARDLYEYMSKKHFLRESTLDIHWIPMGCDILPKEQGNTRQVRPLLKMFLKEEVFLMVGTVEIRKNCETVLKSFGMALKDANFRGNLLIIGKDGWRNEAAKAELKLLPKERVLWLQDASDEELYYSYRHCSALVNASKAEGYGLPLIEAAQLGLPIIISDIPIFHEVAGNNALYFDNSSPDVLAKVLLGWKKRKAVPDSRKIKLHTWDETAKVCLDVFRGSRKKYLAYGEHNKKQRILYDVSNIITFDGGTGIQRSVKEIYKAIYPNPNYEVIPCDFKSCCTGYRFHEMVYGIPKGLEERKVDINHGDVLFFMDASWDEHEKLGDIMAEAHKKGAKVYVFFHDLIPLRHKELLSPRFEPKNFKAWTRLSLKSADGILGNSEATLDDVRAYMKEAGIRRKVPFSCLHFGFELPKVEEKARAELKNFLSGGKTFLMVGTLEVRKDHLTALRALEFLSEKGNEAKLLIIGHEGWGNAPVKEKIAEINRNGSMVLWLSDADDGELAYSYRHAFALIQASVTEGYGLPLIEASCYGLPLICSDISVFREVTEGKADFFPLGDYEALADIMVGYLSKGVVTREKLQTFSWQDTAKELLKACMG